MNASTEVLVILVSLVGTGLFAGLETGVISIHRLRLRHLVRERVPGADILQHFLEHPDHLLGTTLAGTNMLMVVASVTAASLATRAFGPWGSAVSSGVMTLVILLGCEYIPKAWFQAAPAYRTRPFARFLKFSDRVLYPVSRAITFLARLLVPAPSPEKEAAQPFITKEELKHLAREGESSGELSSSERRMIHAVFELTHKSCRAIMAPMEEVIRVSESTPKEELLTIARARGLSRLPVFSEETERFIGIVYIFDILTDTEVHGKTARDYMRPPQFVSADTPADDLLPRMRLTRQPMLLVVDRQSNVVGLVTIEDVLAEIVGEL